MCFASCIFITFCSMYTHYFGSGFVVSVVRDLALPVKLVGVGEKIDDLRDFQPEVGILYYKYVQLFIYCAAIHVRFSFF